MSCGHKADWLKVILYCGLKVKTLIFFQRDYIYPSCISKS